MKLSDPAARTVPHGREMLIAQLSHCDFNLTNVRRHERRSARRPVMTARRTRGRLTRARARRSSRARRPAATTSPSSGPDGPPCTRANSCGQEGDE
jgi:hypothetical protein